MTKNEEIKTLEQEVIKLHLQIASKNERITDLKNKNEKDLKYIIQEFENENSESVIKKVLFEDYEFVLGGDGRSTPFSETREGQVLDIRFDNIYLSNEIMNKFKEYLKATVTKNIKSVKINGITIY